MTQESIRLSCRTKNFIDTFGLTSSTRCYLKGSTFFLDSGPVKESRFNLLAYFFY
jgi:hypothetical protein